MLAVKQAQPHLSQEPRSFVFSLSLVLTSAGAVYVFLISKMKTESQSRKAGRSGQYYNEVVSVRAQNGSRHRSGA